MRAGTSAQVAASTAPGAAAALAPHPGRRGRAWLGHLQAGGARRPEAQRRRPWAPPRAGPTGRPDDALAGLAGTAASARGRAGAPQPDGEAAGLWLVVGLGNPGPQYAGTRHNVGFEAVDALGRQAGIPFQKRLESNAQVGKGLIAGRRVLLAKPMTFMNNSGEAVQRLAAYYQVPLERVLVVYDDMAYDVGVVKLRGKGGHGGQNGMRSIIDRFGGRKDFPRIRIGIGGPQGKQSYAAHVLSGWKKQEAEEIEFAKQEVVDLVLYIMVQGFEKTLSGNVPKSLPA